MRYVVFYKNIKDIGIRECIGSGSIIAPDQRYSNETIINKVYNKEYPIPDNAIGFKICIGHSILDDFKDITKLIKL